MTTESALPKTAQNPKHRGERTVTIKRGLGRINFKRGIDEERRGRKDFNMVI